MINNINKEWLLKLKKFGFTLTCCMTCLSFTGGINNLSVSHTVKVSKNVRNSIILDNSEYDISTLAFDSEENLTLIDNAINTYSLGKLNTLKIDGSCCGDLSFFRYCDNLKTLIINNFNYLSLEDRENISKYLDLDELYVNVPIEYMLKNPTYRLDLSGLENIGNIYLNSYVYSYQYDISNLILYNVGKDCYDSGRINIFDKCMNSDLLNRIKEWDNKFNDMVIKLSLDEECNDCDKIMEVVYFVNDYLSYDDEVKEYLINNSKDKEVEELIHYYNEYLLSPLFKDNREGVCTNYAALTNVLCYKIGLESYYISGYYVDESGNDRGHAWNLVNVNDKYYIVDNTALDNSITYIVFSSMERQSDKRNSWYDSVLSLILFDVNEVVDSYYKDYYNDTDDILNGSYVVYKENDIVYFNNDKDKLVIDVKYPLRFEEEVKSFIYSSLISLGLGYSIGKDKVKKKEMNKK